MEHVRERVRVGGDRHHAVRRLAFEQQPRVRALGVGLGERRLEREAARAQELRRGAEHGRALRPVQVEAARIVARLQAEALEAHALERRVVGEVQRFAASGRCAGRGAAAAPTWPRARSRRRGRRGRRRPRSRCAGTRRPRRSRTWRLRSASRTARCAPAGTMRSGSRARPPAACRSRRAGLRAAPASATARRSATPAAAGRRRRRRPAEPSRRRRPAPPGPGRSRCPPPRSGPHAGPAPPRDVSPREPASSARADVRRRPRSVSATHPSAVTTPAAAPVARDAGDACRRSCPVPTASTQNVRIAQSSPAAYAHAATVPSAAPATASAPPSRSRPRRTRPGVKPTARSRPTSRRRCSTPKRKNSAVRSSADPTRNELK